MAWTTPKVFTSGALTSSDMNTYVSNNDQWLKDALAAIGQTSDSAHGQLKSAAYACSAYRSSNQALVTATNTTITLPSEYKDTNGFHSTVSSTERITIPTAGDGDYIVGYTVKVNADASGDRRAGLEVNSVEVDWGETLITAPSASNDASLSTSALWHDATAGDYLSLVVRQGSGGNLPLVFANLWVVRLFAA